MPWGTASSGRIWTETVSSGIPPEFSGDVDGDAGEFVWRPIFLPFPVGLSWSYVASGFMYESTPGGGPWTADAWVMTARVFVPTLADSDVYPVEAGSHLTFYVSRPFANGILEMSVSHHSDALRFLRLKAGPNDNTIAWDGAAGWIDVTWTHRTGGGNVDEADVGGTIITVPSAGSGAFAAHSAGLDIEAGLGGGGATGSGTPPDHTLLDGFTWKVDCINFA